MTSRRADAAPGLIDRVRWGNVGRLAALLAGAVMLVTGPHGCGAPARVRSAEVQSAEPPLVPSALPPAVKEAPAVQAKPVRPSLPVVRKKQQLRKHRRRHHHPTRKPSPARPNP